MKKENFLLLVWIAVLALIFFLTSCASPPQLLQPQTFYKRDMEIQSGDRSGVGALVLPSASQYDLHLRARGQLDLFTLTSCHRENTQEDAGQGGFFSDHRRLEFLYTPVKGIEDQGACPVSLGGYEKSQGRHSWGFIDFEGPDATLPAQLRCNGAQSASQGVSVCQAKSGLIEEIEFPSPALYIPDPAHPECALSEKKASKVFRFEIPTRECVHAFQELTLPGRVHRLTTLGYESILIREN